MEILENDVKWAITPEIAEKGVLVASDRVSEWMLPWWWRNYHKHNIHPVAFVDFGMSQSKLDFCKQKGIVISPAQKDIKIADRGQVDPELVKYWETIHSPQYLWQSRNGWFRKPIALLLTPFKKTVWLDVDCQVLGDIDPLYELTQTPAVIALAQEPQGIINMLRGQGRLENDKILFNSGVIVTLRDNPLILLWAKNCVSRNSEFLGDQDLLSSIIYEKGEKISIIPPKYNWRMIDGPNPDAIIIHWAGVFGKRKIRMDLYQD